VKSVKIGERERGKALLRGCPIRIATATGGNPPTRVSSVKRTAPGRGVLLGKRKEEGGAAGVRREQRHNSFRVGGKESRGEKIGTEVRSEQLGEAEQGKFPIA